MAGGGWVSTHEDITERLRTEQQIAHIARHDAFRGLEECAPARAVEAPVQRCLYGGLARAAADAPALQASRNDFRVVDDHRVARPQKVGQIANAAVSEFALRTRMHDKKPRRVTRHTGAQGNALRRQVEREFIRPHARSCHPRA